MSTAKTHLFRAEGFVVVLMSLGYLALTFYSLWKWNETVSGGLITGYALFAQKAIGDFFALTQTEAQKPDPATSIISTTQTQKSEPVLPALTEVAK